MRYEVHGDIVLIFIRQRKLDVNKPELITLIDTADLEKFQSFKGSWHIRQGSNSFYMQGQTAGRVGEQQKVLLHRYLMNPPNELVVDHVNGNGLDNRRSSNLRIVTQSVNKFNLTVLHARNTSGHRGVSWLRSLKKWRSACTSKGTTYSPVNWAPWQQSASRRKHSQYEWQGRELRTARPTCEV